MNNCEEYIEKLIKSISEKIYNKYYEKIKDFENNNDIIIKNELYESGKMAINKILEKNKLNSDYNIIKDDNITWLLRQAMIKRLSYFNIAKK